MWYELIKTKKAVIFDLDGTVVDSMWMWEDIDRKFFAKYNISLPDDYQKRVDGMSFYETALFTKETYGFPCSVEEIMNEWNQMAFDYYSNDVMLRECAHEFLDYLFCNNIKLGIATSNSTELCMEVLNKRGISHYFGTIITGDVCLNGKPAPDVYLKAAENLGVEPKDCLVFEDLYQGVQAGNNAGMTTVAIWGEYSDKSWNRISSESDYNIRSYKEIVDEVCR